MPPKTEVWRAIPGYAGRYEASDQGQIRSVGFYVRMNHANGQVISFWKEGQILKGGRVPSGHRYVKLIDPAGTVRTLKVHRLVLLTHVGPPPADKPFALHRDDDPANNRVDNLYWGNRPSNAHDSVRNGTHVQARKVVCPLGHHLAEPNLVPSTSARGFRGCLACKKTQASHHADTRLRAEGRERTTYYRAKDGFQRRRGESFQEEADRRYAHIMAGHRV